MTAVLHLEAASAPREVSVGAWSAFRWSVRRDVVLALRSRAEVLLALVFFVVVASLFPLGVGPEPKILATIAAGVVWVCALLACLLSLPRVFSGDYADGTLEQMLLAPAPLLAVIGGKVFAHWLTTGVPLALMAPLIGLQFGLRADELGVLLVSLLLGTPILSFLGAIGAALTLGLRASGVLIALLVLPLYAPVLIFGAGAVSATQIGLSPTGHLSLLAAGLLIGVVGAPWAIAAAVRIAVE
jgi:heme exporter protein B